MWVSPLRGEIYQAQKIGLLRGLFALAYHIDFPIENKTCTCDVCGCYSDTSVTTFVREKYTGSYGSTKTGRDKGAGWWLHPYTPISVREDGIFPVGARDQNWQSWQELSHYVVSTETNKGTVEPAYIVKQHRELASTGKTHLLVGGNIADQGSVIGRVYDLYSMPSSLKKQLSKVTQVVDAGLKQKDKLSLALNKLFGIGYDKNFVAEIKSNAANRFVSNAQQIVQQTLLDVDNKEASTLRRSAAGLLNQEAKKIYSEVQRKYQHDLPLFKALIEGEYILNKE